MNKKISAILALVLAISSLGASAQFRWGPSAGINIADLSFKQDLVGVSAGVGYAAGIQCEFMFPGIGLGIDFGAFYNQTGANVSLGDQYVWASQGYGKERVYLHNFQVPFHLRFKYSRLNGVEDYFCPFVFGGPELQIQVGHGSIKSNGQPAFDYSGGDLGLSAGLGFEVMRHWQISGYYTWGMTYVLKTSVLDNFSAKCSSWNVRVAYLF